MNYLIPNRRSRQQLQEDSRTILMMSGITNLAPGTTAYAMLSAVDGKLAQLWQDLSDAVLNGFPTTASGIYLDLWGQTRGIPRLGSGTLSVRDNQKFFVPRGMLGDYTGGKDLPLTAVEVSTPATGLPIWRVIPYRDGSQDYPVWSASSREIYVRTEAVTSGADANCGAGKLTRHNMPYDYVLTTNTAAITGGRTVEDDDSYRYRLLDSYLALQGSNATAIEHALLELADVDAVLLQPFVQGPGSVGVVVVPAQGSGDVNLLDRAEAIMNRVLCAGETFQLRLAKTRQLRLQLRVVGMSVTDAQTATLVYLGRLNAGDPLVASALVGELIKDGASDAALVAINLDGQSLAGQNVTLASDEIFVVPTPIADSIKVDAA